MKRWICLYIASLLICLQCSLSVSADSNAKKIAEEICQSIPSEFGYVDNTEYQLKCYFSPSSFFDDCCIMINSDSTNFDEIGVFYVESQQDIKLCEKQVKQYLKDARERFMNGVIYNVKEYPKFEKATTITIDHYVIYLILSEKQQKDIIETLKNSIR